jgi:hypothetical protein
MNKSLFLKLWSLGVGAMDALTGLLLIIAPSFVLQLLFISPPSSESLVFQSWIGVFVMSVGLSYSWALSGRRVAGETVWGFTALVRMLVALFLAIQITRGTLHPMWAIVAVSDASVAIVQIVILWLGWWKEEKP